jgi:hypothetical protein
MGPREGMLPNGQVSGGRCNLPPEAFALPPVGVGEAPVCVYQFTCRRAPLAMTKRRSARTARTEPRPRSTDGGLVHLAPRKWFTSWPAMTFFQVVYPVWRQDNRAASGRDLGAESTGTNVGTAQGIRSPQTLKTPQVRGCRAESRDQVPCFGALPVGLHGLRKILHVGMNSIIRVEKQFRDVL